MGSNHIFATKKTLVPRKSNYRHFFTINRTTLRYKIFYFFQQLAAASILTFFSVFFRHLGMSALQTGILVSCRPLIRLVGAPFWGIIADKTGKYKHVLVTNMVCSVAIYFSMSGVLIAHEYDNANAATSNVTQYSVTTPNVTRYSESHATQWNGTQNYVRYATAEGNAYGKTLNQSGITLDMAQDYKPLLTNREIFLALVVIVLFGDFFYAPILPVMDATVTYWEGTHNFGRQRMFDALGFGLGAFISGLLMDKTSGLSYFGIGKVTAPDNSTMGNHDNPSWTPNYMTSFFMYLACGIAMTTSTALLKFDLIKQETPDFPWHLLKKLLTKPSLVGFLVIATILGLINSATTWYVYWFVQDLGGTQLTVGLTETVMSFSQVLFYNPANHLRRRLGNCWFIALICVVYATQLIFYSFLNHPWYVLMVEVLHGFNFCALQVMCTTYASENAPKGLAATLQTLVYASHFGLGWSLGAFLGGHFYGEFGPRVLFRGLAVVSGFTLLLVATLHVFTRRRQGQQAEEVFAGVDVRSVEYELIESEFYGGARIHYRKEEESWSKNRLIDY